MNWYLLILRFLAIIPLTFVVIKQIYLIARFKNNLSELRWIMFYVCCCLLIAMVGITYYTAILETTVPVILFYVTTALFIPASWLLYHVYYSLEVNK